MAKYDTEAIAKAIKDAAAHAKAVADFEDFDDMGTCNFDATFLPAKGMTEAQAKEIEKASGVNCAIFPRTYGGRILMLGGTEGQGNRRTKMAELMRKHLQAAGFEAHMWYAMD